MKIHDLQPPEGSNRGSKRVARGIGGKGGKQQEGDQRDNEPEIRSESDLRVAKPTAPPSS